ncbi:CHAT domain-containing protein [Sphaerisporangium rubeum]|uniref:Tetratricopeptide (TPR) repeat protein n=1 Tax=Sphaerisporangium rubeum TaxID=321317 RepID=A0A7X0IEG9_9ACTN|nr:CHAT domain-containing tetratricopeptide repeat protein [Sphaerisporangium rubeum]MBB6473759.1 tetratricopeptide (TPR) repeat protein [Sphaerisporangium rubeum]
MADKVELFQALLQRLEHFESTRDPLPLLEASTVEQAGQLLQATGGGDDETLALHLLAWLHWYRHLVSPEEENLADLKAAVRMFIPCFVDDTGSIPVVLLPFLADHAIPYAEERLQHAIDTSDQGVIVAVVRLWRRILDHLPEDSSERHACLGNLAAALELQFRRLGTVEDADESIDLGRQAVLAAPEIDDRAVYLNNLGTALRGRFERTGFIEDLDEAIAVARQALQATSAGHPGRAGRLNTLGNALQTRFGRVGVIEDLDEAISTARQAVVEDHADSPDHAMYLNNLGNALQIRFERMGALEDLNEAINVKNNAVRCTPAGHPDSAGRLSNLGSALSARFGRIGVLRDLDQAVEVGRRAVRLAHLGDPDRAMYLNNLGNALQVRFQRIGVLEDLDEAVEVARQAVQVTPDDHPVRVGYLNNLGGALQLRFLRMGVLADLDEAVESGRQAVRAIAPGHPDEARCLGNLGNALWLRFDNAGTLRHLDEAVEVGRRAVRLAHLGDPDRAMYLNNLGNALQVRFQRIGVLEDLDEAVEVARQAVQVTPDDHPVRVGYLNNLGGALQLRFLRMGVLADLDEAVESGRQAVRAIAPGHPDEARCLSNLGNALRMQSEQTGALDALNEAVGMWRQVVQVTPTDHPDRPMYLSNLGVGLRYRYERTGVLDDLDEAVEVGRQAVQASSAGDPDRAVYLSNLGNALGFRHERLGTDGDLDAAVSAYEEVVGIDSAAPSMRIGAAEIAANLCATLRPRQAAALLESAVELLPQVAPRRLARSDQQYAVGAFHGLAADAAALALAVPGLSSGQRATKALRLLEAARAILLSQALRTRSDLTDLRAQHPGVATRFVELRDLLDRPLAGRVANPLTVTWQRSTIAVEPVVDDRRRLADEFTALLDHIRSLENFGSFALPPSVDELLEQAGSGPVIVLNISRHRSDALLLAPDGITALELPGLTPDTVLARVNAFQHAVRVATDLGLPEHDRGDADETVTAVLGWLWDEVAGPVLSALGYHGPPPADGDWPRVWWVPGGLLSLLPLHAAGHHTGSPDLRHGAVMDRVVSSYTPTISALRHARERAETVPVLPQRGLVVAMPTTPGKKALRYVSIEAAKVRERLPDPVVLTETGDGELLHPDQVPTTSTVLAHLAGCAFAHFACHGVSDPADPSNSRLLLHDHLTSPLTVSALAPVALDHARLAYLSACRTAFTGVTELLDEAIHLASAFQLAGFPHVVATLWPINDHVAFTVTTAFYTVLSTGKGTLDPDQAAFALHRTIRGVRSGFPATPSLWAAHIHAGA